MRLTTGAHLTYCTNIHPGEDLPSVLRALREHVLHVKQAVAPHRAFGIGLRLSNQASQQLDRGTALADLQRWLAEHDCYVFTLNGFPYGQFHGTRVKEHVYAPDWRSEGRLRYSNRLADQLAALLPEDVDGSVSTVPGAWKASLNGEHDVARMVGHLLQHAAHLHALRRRTGRTVALALEPEPGCFLETTAECVQFFEQHLYSTRAAAELARHTGLDAVQAHEALRRHLGVCIDTCHAAVEFEDPTQVFEDLHRAGIGIKKLQLSAGLRLARVDDATLRAVARFADDVYLHQTVARTGDELVRYADLPDALTAAASDSAATRDTQWRVHCHVPIFLQNFDVLDSTQDFLRAVLAAQRSGAVSRHLEVETYTWDVLPAELQTASVDDAIARELRFVLDALGDAGGA